MLDFNLTWIHFNLDPTEDLEDLPITVSWSPANFHGTARIIDSDRHLF